MTTDARGGRLEARPRIVALPGPTGLRVLGLQAERDGFLYAPTSAQEPMPLALVLHGHGGDVRQAIDLLQDAADEHGVLLLAPVPGFLNVSQARGRPDVFVSHGRRDEVLPVASCGRRVVQWLRGDGYHVEYHEFDGGHVVPADAARAAFARVARRRLAPDVGNAARADAHVPDSRPGAG